MPRRRPGPRGPLRYPVRLVKAAAARPQIAPDEANGWIDGLRGAWALKKAFPEFVAEQQLERELLTLPLLLGCACALFQLAEQAGAMLRWPGEWGLGVWGEGITRDYLYDTPAETLRQFDGVDPQFITDMGGFIWSPQPAYFGWGVQTLLERGNYPEDILTAALWHLLQDTPIGLGIELNDVVYQHISAEDRAAIERMRPLPRGLPIQLFAHHLELAIADEYGIEPMDLIGYPLGHTSNELANYDDVDRAELMMGEWDDDFAWTDIAELAIKSSHARQINEAYQDFAMRVDTIAEVRKLAAHLHKCARLAEAELARGKTLAEILFDPDQAEPGQPDPELAWAEAA